MSKDFFTAVRDRRSFYGITKESPVSDGRIQEMLEDALMHTPSAFHSQSARVVLLLDKQHERLWTLTKEALKKVVPADQFDSSEARIQSFQNGYGTVLFFEDNEVISSLQQQYALYSENFPIWSQQSSGMLQFVVWTGLEIEGFGVSLQHYNELIEAEIKETWRIPESWKLIAQMPFGKPSAQPDEKQFQPMKARLRIFK